MQALENVQKAVNKAYEHSVIGARNLGVFSAASVSSELRANA